MAVVNVTEQEFEQQVLRSELPVLVDLAADWCQPCKQLEPILKQLSEELAPAAAAHVDRPPAPGRASPADPGAGPGARPGAGRSPAPVG